MMAATDSFTSSFQFEDNPAFITFPIKKMLIKMAYLKANVQMPRVPHFKSKTYDMLTMEPYCVVIKNDLEKLTQALHMHFLKFGLVGSGTERSTTVAMYFLPTLEETMQHTQQNRLPLKITINDGKNFVFIKHFKYLGAYIFDILKEYLEILVKPEVYWVP